MGPIHHQLRQAAQAIRRGWVQGHWRDEDGNVCLLQAVSEALGYEGTAVTLPWKVQLALDSQLMTLPTYCNTRALRRKRRKLLRQGTSIQQLIWGWNDADGRTKEEVAGALDALADRLEGQYRLWVRDLVSRAVQPSTRWRHVDLSELELDEELMYA
jgi:hypothetical protein